MSDFISMMSLNNQIIFIDREPCVKAESRDVGSLIFLIFVLVVKNYLPITSKILAPHYCLPPGRRYKPPPPLQIQTLRHPCNLVSEMRLSNIIKIKCLHGSCFRNFSPFFSLSRFFDQLISFSKLIDGFFTIKIFSPFFMNFFAIFW